MHHEDKKTRTTTTSKLWSAVIVAKGCGSYEHNRGCMKDPRESLIEIAYISCIRASHVQRTHGEVEYDHTLNMQQRSSTFASPN